MCWNANNPDILRAIQMSMQRTDKEPAPVGNGGCPYRHRAGITPLLVSCPHAGTELAPGLIERFTPAARDLPDTDWHVDRLYDFAPDSGAGLLVARFSRYVIDLNRPPDDAPLYPGIGTGLVPMETFSGEMVYRPGRAPGEAEIRQRVERYWTPYHARLELELNRLRREHGFAVLLEAHTIASRVPRLFDGRLPDLNLGTHGGASCDAGLAETAWSMLAAAGGITAVRDGRFRGGYITRHYGRPSAGIHALQLEIGQDSYLDPDRPRIYESERAQKLRQVLRGLVLALIEWRPR